MATDNVKIRRYERSDRQKYMERNFTSALGGPESVMKFSPQRLESPPPKPPRRRYSDQLSVSALGNYSSKKGNEENQRNDLKINRYSPKPTYLSLPTNLSSNVLTECDDTSNLLSDSLGPSNQLEHSREEEFFVKYFLDNLHISENGANHTYESNRFSHKEKLQSVIQGTKIDPLLSKYQYENLAPCIIDNLSKKHLSTSKILMTNTFINQNLKSFHKECHRRHHSDPAISYFNVQSDNSMKFDCKQCCDNISFSSNKVNKYCDSTGCLCCKKSYLFMQEIRILKEINEKLWQHLCSLQTCLESMKKNVYDECTDVSVSGLLSSIYYAQKAKDSAMEGRLKIALEERNAAIHELEDLIRILTKSFSCTDGEKEIYKDLEELLGEMESLMTPSNFLKYQRILLAHIHSFKDCKEDCLSQKLKQAEIGRNNALEKVKKLEEDVKDLKLSYGLWHSDNKNWEFTMFDILSQVIHQRDTIFSKIDNGFDIGNAIYRQPTNKLESVEHQNIYPFESRSIMIESFKSHQPMHLIDYKQQHFISTSDEVIKLKEEILLLNKALDGEKKKREQTEGKCLRLERLIHILRKKLNGQNIGVPV